MTVTRWFILLLLGAGIAAALLVWPYYYHHWVIDTSVEAFPARPLMRSATQTDDISSRCQSCHQEQFADWYASQHARAQSLLGKEASAYFTNDRFPHDLSLLPAVSAGQPGFRDQRTGEFWPARAIIGVEPLRQYLLPLAGGRLQVAPLSFDPHRGDWFDPQEPPRATGDWSYWSNRGMNWNSQCAFCHTTDLQKNYNIATDSYSTTWTTMGISCSQCHGDVSAHLAEPDNPSKRPGLAKDRVMDNCASCHSRREELTGTFHPGELFADHYRLTLPDEPGIYYADGQVREENFEYGSLRLSRMGHAGVTCLDCHNPHSGKLKLPVENNALCMSCHSGGGALNAPVIQPDAHSHHKAGTAGSLCVDCHMPETTYMVRDPRRDHGFTSPDPQLTIELGIPNSCNRCHTDQSAEWARDYVNQWYGAEKMDSRPTRLRARVIQNVQTGNADDHAELLAMAQNEENAAWRATLVGLLAPWRAQPDVASALLKWLADPDPLVRAAAVRATSFAGGPVDFPQHVLNDPIRFVRLEAAWQLALRGRDIPRIEELRTYLDNQSDQPTGAVKQAQWALVRGDGMQAVSWARKAADWDKTSAASKEVLAMTLYATGERSGAREAFEAAVELEPAQASPAFSLGLLLAEEGDIKGSIVAFEKAVAADEGFGRAWYNLGLARSQLGEEESALAALDRAEKSEGNQADAAYAAATILLRLGKPDEARSALQRALTHDASHTPSMRLRDSLGR